MPLSTVKPIGKILLVMMLAASPAWAQTQLTPKAAPKSAARVVDNCAPIGKTARGELVYSMKCDNLPAPPPSPPQAEAREATPAAAPEPEVKRGGIFGWSYDRRE